MSKWELTEEAFSFFLSWLDPDKDTAGQKYIGLQRRLVVMLECRGCTCSEELADRALNNFIRRLPALVDSYADNHNPAPYLFTIAHHLYLDYVKKQPAPLPDSVAETPLTNSEPDETEARFYACLEVCLEQLKPRHRELLLDYYEGEKQAKIDFRKIARDYERLPETLADLHFLAFAILMLKRLVEVLAQSS